MNFVDRLIAPLSTSARARLGANLLEAGRAAEGFRHLARAALGGSVKAQYRVGLCYLEGIGVPRATVEAVRWLERAAEACGITGGVALSGNTCFPTVRWWPRKRRPRHAKQYTENHVAMVYHTETLY